METRIPLIALAVLCSVLLMFNDYTKVYALSHIDLTVAGSQNWSSFVPNSGTSNNQCRLFTLTTAQKINVINCDNHTILTNNGTLGTTGSSCRNNGLLIACNLGTGTFSGLECARLDCFTKFTNGTHQLLVRYTHITGFSSVTGFISWGTGSPIDDDAIESFSTSAGDSTTVWFVYQCSGADTDRVIAILDGLAMISSGLVDGAISCTTASGTGGNLGANSGNDLLTIITGTTRYLAVTTDQAVNNFRKFRLDTNAFVCMFSGATSNQITYDSDNTEFLLMQNAVSGDVVRIENNASCTNNGSITDVTLGTTGLSLQDGDVNEGRNEFYVSASGSKVIAVNTTNQAKIFEYALAGSNIIATEAIESNSSEIIGVSTSTVTRFVIVQEGAGADGDEQLTEFCAIAGNEDLLACFETPALVGASELIGDSFQDLFVQVGLIDGSNMNCATNGVGYFMTATALGIMIGIFWVASRGDLTNIPTFIWFLASLAIVSAITIMDCLDPVWFIIAVIAIIALAVAKTKSNIFGSFVGE